jgi:hypothetical protein
MASQPAETSSQVPSSRPGPDESTDPDPISEDDICPVCHLLLFKPVKTRCSHLLCSSCMAHWADVSVTSQMTIVSLDDQPSSFDPIQIEANCPMCRTRTTASLDTQLEEDLKTRYPVKYTEREVEERAPEDGGEEVPVETLTLYIGNEHRMVLPQGGDANRHEWTFFVRPSRTDIIEEVQLLLVRSMILRVP